MRWLPLLALGVTACGFDQNGLPAGHVLRDDSAADFGAAGSTTDGVEITSDGLITPLAFTTGALLAKGANSELFQDPTTIDWTTLDANTPARIALSVPLGDFGNGAPAGVGISSNDHFTIWLAGDIWLEAGQHTFVLGADDNGLLELAPGPGAPFTRVVAAQWFQGDQTGTFTAPADGWYPIHVALSEQDQTAYYRLQHQPPGGTMGPIDPDRMRVAVGDQRGLVADAFNDFYLMQPAGRSLTAAAMLDQQFGASPPADSGITSTTKFSMHWAAQARIDVGGDYALELDTDNGQRLRVDGALAIDKLITRAQDNTTTPIHLDPGWHDVVIDYQRVSGAAHARLRVASGPELAGMTFPPDRVRPVVPRVDRVAGDSEGTYLSFAAGGTVTHPLAPAIPSGATVDGVDVEYTINATNTRDLRVTLIAPDGSRAVVRPQGDTNVAGALDERRTTHMLDGKAAAGSWQIEVTDASGIDAGSCRFAAATVHYIGGKPPITASATYESAARDLGMPSHIDDLTFSAPMPPGSGVVVKVRTGATVDALMASPWSDPVTSDAPPIVPDGEFFQYRVELSSDGDHSAAFDWLQIVYRSST